MANTISDAHKVTKPRITPPTKYCMLAAPESCAGPKGAMAAAAGCESAACSSELGDIGLAAPAYCDMPSFDRSKFTVTAGAGAAASLPGDGESYTTY